MKGAVVNRNATEFSFVLGGPLFRLERRLGLTGAGLQLAHRRIIAVAALAWVPLLVLSAIQGRALGGSVAVPFLHDIDTHARFLFVVPLLMIAEFVVHQRVRLVAQQFLDREIVPADARPRFERIVQSTNRLRNSVAAELALIAFVYGVGVFIVWRRFTALDASTWFAVQGMDRAKLSTAGIWYVFFSLPLAQFLMLRWYYRIFIWARFLWQVARLPLHLVATHPDRVGGLGFLSLVPFAFAPLAVAHGALLASWIANRIAFNQAALLDFKIEIIALTVIMGGVVFGPLLAFGPRLAEAWRKGEQDYGPLASRYAAAFETKWLGAERPDDDALHSTRDVQGLADMARVYDVVQAMRFAPVSRPALIQLLIATLAPLVPLVFTMMPLGELVRRLTQLVF